MVDGASVELILIMKPVSKGGDLQDALVVTRARWGPAFQDFGVGGLL